MAIGCISTGLIYLPRPVPFLYLQIRTALATCEFRPWSEVKSRATKKLCINWFAKCIIVCRATNTRIRRKPRRKPSRNRTTIRMGTFRCHVPPILLICGTHYALITRRNPIGSKPHFFNNHSVGFRIRCVSKEDNKTETQGKFSKRNLAETADVTFSLPL